MNTDLLVVFILMVPSSLGAFVAGWQYGLRTREGQVLHWHRQRVARARRVAQNDADRQRTRVRPVRIRARGRSAFDLFEVED